MVKSTVNPNCQGFTQGRAQDWALLQCPLVNEIEMLAPTRLHSRLKFYFTGQTPPVQSVPSRSSCTSSTGHPYWPIQVAKVKKDAIHFVYFGSGHVGKVAKTAASDLLPFTDENVKLLKTKSAKLSQVFQLAKESM